MSQEITLARPYARAAFGLARDRGDFAGWSKALAFSARVAADPGVMPLLGHPSLSDAEAVELLAPESAGAEQRDFLALLAANDACAGPRSPACTRTCARTPRTSCAPR